MRLDSARDLKLTLLEQLCSGRLGTALPRAAGLALAALNLTNDAARQASLAIGIARRGPRDFRLAVRIQQPPLRDAHLVELVRRRARGEADIRYIGRVRPEARNVRGRAPQRVDTTRRRPLVIGCSIGHAATTAGTLGAFVTPRAGAPRLAVLSNAHVLAPDPVARPGDPIVQPAPADGGKARRDTVARLTRAAPLRPGRPSRVDAAYAVLEPGIGAEPASLPSLGNLRGAAAELDIGERVAKIGRSTGLTRGRITALELDNVFVDYGIGRVRFDDQIEIEGAPGPRGGAFSAAGDSGALIITGNLTAAALLFAGSDHGGRDDRGLTYATPLGTVLDALRVSLRLA